jgi:hypothetical protein
MKWITRANANVDRIACPWLIARFVDPDAEFLFVPADQVMATAEREQAIPYDVPNVELGHVDGLNAIARGFALLHGEADHEKIRLETPMYDALYAWCQSRVTAAMR